MVTTISEISILLSSRQLSPVELTRRCLERIEKLDPQLNCFITLLPELALQQARQAETELMKGINRGPLHGIPIALKDLYETSGIRTTAGSKVLSDHIPTVDAAVVQKLSAAGAILLGKLNMHEIALGVTNENPHFGDCHNPWALDRMTGGSSGGSAAALAAGLCLGSLGSDTGGSIRIPASLCGVVGLKPTRGRVSLSGVIPLSWNLDHAGPLARCVRDAALLLQAVAGYDAEDPTSENVPVDDYMTNLGQGVRGWRVALAEGEYFQKADEAVQSAIRQAGQIFSALGALVEPVQPPDLRPMALANGLMVISDAAAFHRERLASRADDFGPDVRQRLESGAGYTSSDYILARRTQSLARRQLERFFETYDLLLLPATPTPAPRLHQADAVERARQLTRFTAPFNLTGLPAISVHAGFIQEGADRLPIGLQIVARPWAEARLLAAAYAYEQAAGWYLQAPPSFK